MTEIENSVVSVCFMFNSSGLIMLGLLRILSPDFLVVMLMILICVNIRLINMENTRAVFLTELRIIFFPFTQDNIPSIFLPITLKGRSLDRGLYWITDPNLKCHFLVDLATLVVLPLQTMT